MFTLPKTTLVCLLAVASAMRWPERCRCCPTRLRDLVSARRETRDLLLLSSQSLQPTSSAGLTVTPPTVMLTYGGSPGNFNDKAEWFGFKKPLLAADADADAGWASVIPESALMKAAVVEPRRRFPIPFLTEEVNARQIITAGFREPDDVMRALAVVDASDAVVPFNNRALVKDQCLRVENTSVVSFESKGRFGPEFYYFYGPFTSVAEMLGALADDPMLKPVSEKWAKFAKDGKIDDLPEFTNLYLQIQWFGWFVRPVVEVNRPQWDALIKSARPADPFTARSTGSQ